MNEPDNLYKILLSLARLEVLVKRMEDICDETEEILKWKKNSNVDIAVPPVIAAGP